MESPRQRSTGRLKKRFMTALANKKPGTGFSIGMLVLKLRTLIAFLAVLIVFSFIAPNFLSITNLIAMAKHSAIWAILAVGMTYVIIGGGIDLSIGSIVGLCGMIAGGLIAEGLRLPIFGIVIYFNVPMIILIVLLIGVLLGAVNGLIITKLGVAPFIATLGMLYMGRGFAMLRSGGKTFPNLIGNPALGNTGFPILGAGTMLGIPLVVWIAAVIAIIAAYVSQKTPFGRHIYAVGGNEDAAVLSGIRVNRLKMAIFMFSGFTAALTGLVLASQLVASHPATGEAYEMTAIAAVVLGGASLNGGRGSIGGTIIGALILGVLNDGLVMIGVSSFWQTAIKGMVLVLAVVIDQYQLRKQNEAALHQQQADEKGPEKVSA
ncbi:ABC transporter permease [Sediminispirochaeta smaragdinae]|uniref:Inner-membrane translocator n=1 Tax=Sediminispirochaeta smaragdinae (strain DSM 11293 / JCM 15392 / SEBR 4228) TaxID=573413 RepID=E1RA98_SEDSS|nr:ABC transporter permease [Sediminispirochaeta smaragdinae]ADK79389.1 inner-membrane translocator [Sediminispirochaeta smaragdinae DSM 11293]